MTQKQKNYMETLHTLIFEREFIMAKRNFKRLLVVSDFHCGHKVGLTPPDWWYDDRVATGRNAKIAKYQRELWNWYEATIKSIRPVDYLVVNGDAIDGKGGRSGSSEQAQADRNEQCKMAVKCIDMVKASEVGIIYGTPYHAGTEEDWEFTISEMVETPVMFVSGQKFFELNGVMFDFKHKIASSTIPHGRFTAIAREQLWNTIWSSRGQQPKADVIVRSHVHYHIIDEDPAGEWTGIITPGLQGFGSNYGVRQVSFTIDIGMIYFDVKENKEWALKTKLAQLSQQKARITSR